MDMRERERQRERVSAVISALLVTNEVPLSSKASVHNKSTTHTGLRNVDGIYK